LQTFSVDWTVDSIVYRLGETEIARYAKGSNPALWPQGPIPVNLGIWAGAAWMGPYAYDPAAPPT
jgi:hypothetical protein